MSPTRNAKTAIQVKKKKQVVREMGKRFFFSLMDIRKIFLYNFSANLYIIVAMYLLVLIVIVILDTPIAKIGVNIAIINLEIFKVHVNRALTDA